LTLEGLERYDDACLAIRRAIEVRDGKERSEQDEEDLKRALQQKKLVEFLLFNAGHCCEALDE